MVLQSNSSHRYIGRLLTLALTRPDRRKFKGLFEVPMRLGPGGMSRLIDALLIDPLRTAILRSTVGLRARLKLRWTSLFRARELRRWRDATGEIVEAGRVRANLDLAGPGPGVRITLPETRFYVDIVATAEYWGVRKRYRGEWEVFLRELNALHRLGRLGLRVPAILDIDFDGPSLVTSYVGGGRLDPGSAPTVELLAADMRQIHRAGMTIGEIRPDMFVIGIDQRPWWVNFETTEDYSGLAWDRLRFLADADVDQFNNVFAAALPTYESLRRRLQSNSEPELQHWYSPAYLGAGLRTGRLWNLGAGWGRWEYLLSRTLPDLAGRRILDLGAANGHNGLEMLRAGASTVVGLEMNPERVTQGRFLKDAWEWCDGTTYDYVAFTADMRDAPRMGLGSFDMVTAFCSMYYLSEQEMAGLVRDLSEMTPILVMQCNERIDIGRDDDDTYRRASLEFTVSMLKANGFPEVEVVAPPGYQRPMAIGHRA